MATTKRKRGSETPERSVRAVSNFVKLVHADWRGNHREAAAALECLASMGVRVQFTSAWRTGGGA